MLPQIEEEAASVHDLLILLRKEREKSGALKGVVRELQTQLSDAQRRIARLEAEARARRAQEARQAQEHDDERKALLEQLEALRAEKDFRPFHSDMLRTTFKECVRCSAVLSTAPHHIALG